MAVIGRTRRAGCVFVYLMVTFICTGISGVLAQTTPGFLCVSGPVVNGDSCQSLFAKSQAAPPPGQATSIDQLIAWNPALNCANLAVGMQICLTEPIPAPPDEVPAAIPAPTATPTPPAGQGSQIATTIPPGLPVNPTSVPTTVPPVLPATTVPPPLPTPVVTTPVLAKAATTGGPSPTCGTDFCCKMNVVGTGVVGGIASASIACVPSVQNPNPAAVLLVYLGNSLFALAPSFTGILARPANEAGFLSPNAIFFVSLTPLSVTIADSSFTNIANSHSPLITFETGVTGAVTNSIFSGNTGQLHGTIAVSSQMHIDVIGCQFTGNACSCGGPLCGDSTCHNAAIYVTEGATSNIVGCTFTGNVGHFGTGLLVTSGGSFSISGSTFTGNRVDVSGSFGGAIAFNRCGLTSNGVPVASTGSITNCIFDGNSTPGYGGAIAVDACPAITVTGSTFHGNIAGLAGGAVFLSNVGAAGTPDGSCFGDSNTAPLCGDVSMAAGFTGAGAVCGPLGAPH